MSVKSDIQLDSCFRGGLTMTILALPLLFYHITILTPNLVGIMKDKKGKAYPPLIQDVFSSLRKCDLPTILLASLTL